MDEPTSALDPISTLKIEELMVELKKKYTVVVVTHNMQQAARVSDDTAFFLVGEVIEFNHTDDIFARHRIRGPKIILQDVLVDWGKNNVSENEF